MKKLLDVIYGTALLLIFAGALVLIGNRLEARR